MENKWLTYDHESKLISAIPARVCARPCALVLFRNFAADISSALSPSNEPRFLSPLWGIRSYLWDARGVGSHVLAYSRIVSTSKTGIKKKEREREKKEKKKSEINDPFFAGGCRRGGITAAHVYTVPLINFHDAHNLARNFPSLVLHFFPLLSCPSATSLIRRSPSRVSARPEGFFVECGLLIKKLGHNRSPERESRVKYVPWDKNYTATSDVIAHTTVCVSSTVVYSFYLSLSVLDCFRPLRSLIYESDFFYFTFLTG